MNNLQRLLRYAGITAAVALPIAWFGYDGIWGMTKRTARVAWGGLPNIATPEPTKTVDYTMPNGKDYSLEIPAKSEPMMQNFLNEHEGKDFTYALKAMDALDNHLDGKADEFNIERVISAIAIKDIRGKKIGGVPASQAYDSVYFVLKQKKAEQP